MPAPKDPAKYAEWIKKFEKIIDENYGGKCFYTKEEYALLKQANP